MITTTLPLVELHRHLDGSVRLETILELGIRHNLPLPSYDLDGLRPHVQVLDPQPGVMAFISKFEWLVGVMVDYDSIRRIAYENIEDVFNEGLDYVELRFSPWFMAQPRNLSPVGVVEAVIDGVCSGQRDFGVQANLIGILSRTYGPQIARKELDALLECKDSITALDLAGDEMNFPATWFADHFKRARDAGWHITVHAGESAGSESIWNAIEILGAERIGHALRALEDPSLMIFMGKNGIGVESCLTSNVQTSCVQGYSSHPLKQFLDSGIRATINTDDPGISAITLPFEYEKAITAAGLTQEQVRQAQVNALDIAFISEDQKNSLRVKKASKNTQTY